MQSILNSFLHSFHYEILIVLASSLLAEELISLIQEERRWKKFLLYLCGYIVSIAVGVAGYAFCRRIQVGSDFGQTFIRFGFNMLAKYIISIFLVPFWINLFKIMTDDKMSVGGRYLIIGLSLLTLIAAPYVAPPSASQDDCYDFNEMIYVRKFYDISNFRERTNKGYVETPPTEQSGSTANSTRTPPSKNIEEMNFREAIEAMLYYDKLPDIDLARKCNDRAYYLYTSGQGNDVPNDIGMMWWYKGSYEDNGEYFYNAGLIFEEAGNHFNAAVSFGPAYRCGCCDSARPLSHYYEAAAAGEKTDAAIDFLFEVYNDEGEKTPYLAEFVLLFPNNLRVQVLNITNHIDKIGTEDLAIIDGFSSKAEYKDCPKLINLKNYYYYKNGITFLIDTGRLEKIDAKYFDPEDIINTAWFFYLKGDSKKAFDFLNTTLPEDEAWGSYFEYNIITSAIFLKEDGIVDEYDAKWNYMDMNNSEANFAAFYNADDTLKYEVLKAYLGKKIGYRTATDEINQAFAKKDYQFVINLCDASIESGHSDRSILLLKADAQTKLADQSNGDQRTYWLTESEKTLLMMKDNVSEDYRDALTELRKLYLVMPDRELEFQQVDDMLRVVGE